MEFRSVSAELFRAFLREISRGDQPQTVSFVLLGFFLASMTVRVGREGPPRAGSAGGGGGNSRRRHRRCRPGQWGWGVVASRRAPVAAPHHLPQVLTGGV